MMERPIIFSAPMVRGLLREADAPGTGKTQTRRLLREGSQVLAREPGWKAERQKKGWFFVADLPDLKGRISCGERYEIGDRLWVRENFIHADSRKGFDSTHGILGTVGYLADGEGEWLDRAHAAGCKNRPSIHMPRLFSRLTLTVTDVRVQRLQEISEEDAIAEGWPHAATNGRGVPLKEAYPIGWYAWLWESLHGAGSYDANPWIVALTFTVAHSNIDALPKQVAA